jgi:hypothetical protein
MSAAREKNVSLSVLAMGKCRIAALLVASLALAGCQRFCSPEKPPPPPPPIPTVKGPDGVDYVLLARGANKPLFDAQGHLERVDYDRNGDGKPDQVARHGGKRIPELVENDDDFDGTTDHWLYYNAAGLLVKIGSSRKGGKPDVWVYSGPDGKPTRQEYDDDGDGKVDRAELLKGGSIDLVEVDADRNGKPDRWQRWEGGRLQYEDIDTDGDAKADKRLRYGPKGEVVKLEPVPQP